MEVHGGLTSATLLAASTLGIVDEQLLGCSPPCSRRLVSYSRRLLPSPSGSWSRVPCSHWPIPSCRAGAPAGVPRPGAALACAHCQDRGPPRHLTPTPVAIDIAAACSGLGVRRFASVQKTRASSLASPRAWRKLLRILLARCSRFCGNNIQARPTGDFLIPSGWPWVQHRN